VTIPELKGLPLLRTGNPQYANWVNEKFGSSALFRGEYTLRILLCEPDVDHGMKRSTL